MPRSPVISDDPGGRCCRDCIHRRVATLECHRHAPLVTGGLYSAVETVWPLVAEDNWCGDFVMFPYDQPATNK